MQSEPYWITESQNTNHILIEIFLAITRRIFLDFSFPTPTLTSPTLSNFSTLAEHNWGRSRWCQRAEKKKEIQFPQKQNVFSSTLSSLACLLNVVEREADDTSRLEKGSECIGIFFPKKRYTQSHSPPLPARWSSPWWPWWRCRPRPRPPWRWSWTGGLGLWWEGKRENVSTFSRNLTILYGLTAWCFVLLKFPPWRIVRRR